MIRRATADDARACGMTMSRAFADDPVMRWFFPDDDDYAALSPVFNTYLMHRFIATNTLWCTDDAVAFAAWVPPGRPEVDVEAERPDIEHPQWRLDRFEAIGEVLGEHTPSEPHWYLNVLGTHPDWQRHGLGGALMAEVFEIADAEGLACYLETEATDLVAYYRHHGFEVRSEWDLPLDGPHMWGMLRSAR